LIWSFRPHYGPGVEKSIKDVFSGKGGRCVVLKNLSIM